MKIVLAILAAGFLGAGAAVGAVSLGLVPTKAPTETAKTVPAPDIKDDAGTGADNTALQAEIAQLRNDLATLRANQPAPAAAGPTQAEVDALKKEIAELKKARPVVVAADGSSPAPAPAVTPEFDSNVRAVLESVEAERRETRRLERQTERLADLERQKTQIAEYVPNLVSNQAERLNIPAEQITAVSNVLVTHAQSRAETRSTRDGERIDGIEVDDAAFDKKLEDLDAATLASLTTYVDQATAENLLRAINGGGRNQRGPAAGGRRGGQGN
jgi:hypothetical protein